MAFTSPGTYFFRLLNLPIYLSTSCPSICLSIYLTVHLLIRLFVYLSFSFCLCSFPRPTLLKTISFPQPIFLSTPTLFWLFQLFEITKFQYFCIKLTPPHLNFVLIQITNLNFENWAFFDIFVLIFTYIYKSHKFCFLHTTLKTFQIYLLTK